MRPTTGKDRHKSDSLYACGAADQQSCPLKNEWLFACSNRINRNIQYTYEGFSGVILGVISQIVKFIAVAMRVTVTMYYNNITICAPRPNQRTKMCQTIYLFF